MIILIQFIIKNKYISLVAATIFLLSTTTNLGEFYIHNRLDLKNEKAVLDGLQKYETTYRPFQDLAQPTVTDIKTKIYLYPEKNAYEVAATYTLKNLTDKPIQKLLFYMDSDIALNVLRVERSKSVETDKDFGHIWVTLSTVDIAFYF